MPVCDGASQTGYLGAESAHSDIGIKDVYRPATGALLRLTQSTRAGDLDRFDGRESFGA